MLVKGAPGRNKNMLTHFPIAPHIHSPKKFSNTWWWNCGSSNYGKTWNAGCASSTRCTNLTFTPFDTSNEIVFLMKLGWENIHGHICSDAVFLKDTLIWIMAYFYNIGLPLKLSIDVSSGKFLYQIITQETNLRKNDEWCHLPTHVT